MNIEEFYKTEKYIEIIDYMYNTKYLDEEMIVKITEKLKTIYEHSYVIVANKNYLVKLFILFCMMYDRYAKENYPKYVGIDYEYNRKKIALGQYCFKIKEKYIFLVGHVYLSKEQKKLIITYLYNSKYIYKILHGSDSIDIPYLYNDFFDNKEEILEFNRKLIDTRFLCEYSKHLLKSTDNKCSIYKGLLYFGTIDKKKYKELEKIEENMGVIWKITWHIDKLSKYQILYALYDVIYLEDFMNDILLKTKKEAKTNYHTIMYIPEMTRLVYIERFGLDSQHIENNININEEYCFDKLNVCSHDFYSIQYFKKILKKLFYLGIKGKPYLKKYKLDKLANLVNMIKKK